MVDLIDLGPARKKITLRGQQVEMRGLPLTFLAGLLGDSPALSLALAQKAVSGDMLRSLVADFPDMVAQCIAMGSGKQGDAATIGFILVELSPGEWLICLEAILELTFPQGVKSFADALFQAARSLGIDAPGWEGGTKSQEPSPASSEPVTFPRALGDTLPANSEHGTNLSEESNSPATASSST